jgi:hypothetical protein
LKLLDGSTIHLRKKDNVGVFMSEMTEMRLALSGTDLSEEDCEALARSLMNELNEHGRGLANFAAAAKEAPKGSKVGEFFTPEIICNLSIGIPALVLQVTQMWLNKHKFPISVDSHQQTDGGTVIQEQLSNALVVSADGQNRQMSA